jgi:hypothetical protein
MYDHEALPAGQQFRLGNAAITKRAFAFCRQHGIDYLALVVRHATGDFGMVGHLRDAQLSRAERQHGSYATDDPLKLNAVAIESRQGMAMSIYPAPDNHDGRIWIQTHLAGDKTCTAILLPNDYHHTGGATMHELVCQVNQQADIQRLMRKQFFVLSLTIYHRGIGLRDCNL